MFSLDEKTIRASFINASRKETSDMSVPRDLADIDWEKLDYFGWRDSRMARRAYVVIPLGGKPVGILLRQADAVSRSRAQCTWCQDVQLPNDVVFYSARRSGPGGRNGNTVGTLICSEFECSANVRKAPPMAYIGFDVNAAREQRIVMLRERAAGFAESVL